MIVRVAFENKKLKVFNDTQKLRKSLDEYENFLFLNRHSKQFREQYLSMKLAKEGFDED